MEQMFRRTAQQVLDQFGVTRQGLTTEQVEKQRATYGENALTEGQKKGPLVVFLEQFKDLLVIILIIAALISAVSGNGESTIVIVAVITLNAILGTVQHFKAEKIAGEPEGAFFAQRQGHAQRPKDRDPFQRGLSPAIS